MKSGHHLGPQRERCCRAIGQGQREPQRQGLAGAGLQIRDIEVGRSGGDDAHAPGDQLLAAVRQFPGTAQTIANRQGAFMVESQPGCAGIEAQAPARSKIGIWLLEQAETPPMAERIRDAPMLDDRGRSG